MIDGIRVLKLNDRSQRAVADSDMMTMIRIWQLLSGGHSLRDSSIAPRRFL
jgi:hypothetical protein